MVTGKARRDVNKLQRLSKSWREALELLAEPLPRLPIYDFGVCYGIRSEVKRGMENYLPWLRYCETESQLKSLGRDEEVLAHFGIPLAEGIGRTILSL